MGKHALSDPILVDVTADDTGAIIKQALSSGMDVVLANKRPLSGSRQAREELETLARAQGRRILFEATVGAGLPILDTYRKLAESGDKVLKIEGCLSGTLGFLLTEIGRGKPFSAALRKAMDKGYTEPDPRDDLSGVDVGRKALILGRLLGFTGEPGDVEVESLVSEASRALPLGDVPRASRRSRRRVEPPPDRRARQGRPAALRRLGDQEQDLGRFEGRRRLEPVRGPQRNRQPGRVHHRALQGKPAGDHRPGSGPRGDRSGCAERYPRFGFVVD